MAKARVKPKTITRHVNLDDNLRIECQAEDTLEHGIRFRLVLTGLVYITGNPDAPDYHGRAEIASTPWQKFTGIAILHGYFAASSYYSVSSKDEFLPRPINELGPLLSQPHLFQGDVTSLYL